MTFTALPVPTPKVKSTALGRIPGGLLAVSALATIGGETISVMLEIRQFSGQGDTDPPFEFLGPTILLGAAAILGMILGYVLLFVWLPKTWPNGAFLALALVVPLSYLLEGVAFAAVILDVLRAAISLFAAIYVLARPVFPLITRLMFAIAMLLVVAEALGGEVSGLLDGSLVVEAVAMFAYAGTQLLFGLTLAIWPRTRSTATE